MFEQIKEQIGGLKDSAAGKVLIGGAIGFLVVFGIIFVAGMRNNLRAEGEEIEAVREGVEAAELMAASSESAIRNLSGGVVSDIDWDTVEGYDREGNPVYATRRTVPTVGGYDMCGAPLSDTDLTVTGKTSGTNEAVFGTYSAVDKARERGLMESDPDIDWNKTAGYDRDNNPVFVSKSGKALGYDLLGNPLMAGSVTVGARTDSGLPIYEYSAIQTARADGKNAQKALETSDPKGELASDVTGKVVLDEDMGVRVNETESEKPSVSVNKVGSIEGYGEPKSVSSSTVGERTSDKTDSKKNNSTAAGSSRASTGNSSQTASVTDSSGSTGSTSSSGSGSSSYGSLSSSDTGSSSSSSTGSQTASTSSSEQNQTEAKDATYTVTFDPDNGKKVSKETVKSGETVTKPTDPVKDGYTFKGWYLDDEQFSFSTKIKKNLTLTAKYGRESYKVMFDWNKPSAMLEAAGKYNYFVFPSADTFYAEYGGTYGDSNKDFPEIGATTDVYGYRFLGWYSGNTKVSSDTDVMQKAVTLTASWQPISYKLTYAKGTDGSGYAPVTDMVLTDAPSTYTVEESVEIPDPTAQGYKFSGWTFEVKKEPVKSLVIPIGTTGDMHLVGHWQGNTITVQYNANGGSGTMRNSTLTYSKGVTLSLCDYTNTGKVFSGWNTRKGGDGTWYTSENGRIEADTSLFKEDGSIVTLYAQWDAVPYYVSFAGNNATEGDMAIQSFTYGVQQSLIACAFSKTGYTFSGWALSGTGAAVYRDGANVSNLTSVPGETVTLYAVWTPITYSVVFNSNSATASTSTQKMTYDTASYLNANSFKYLGHVFRGWGTTPTQYEVEYSDKAMVKNLCSESGDTYNLYALWEPGTYTLTYNANGGTVSQESKQVVFGKTYGTLPTPRRDGYTFNGWTATNSSSGEKVTSDTVMSSEGTTIFAQWTKN